MGILENFGKTLIRIPFMATVLALIIMPAEEDDNRFVKEFASRDSNLEIRLKICKNCIDKVDNSINMNERTNKIKHTESSNESDCVQVIIEKSKMET